MSVHAFWKESAAVAGEFQPVFETAVIHVPQSFPDVIPAILRLPGPGIPPAAPVVWIYFTEDGFPESVLCETETSVYGTVRPFQIGITHNIVRMDVPDEFSEQFSTVL